MQLAVWDDPDTLYLARGEEVSPHRPLFTGDVFESVQIPGVQTEGTAIVVAHPCSMRGKNAALENRILVAAVRPSAQSPANKWASGFLDRMPLPRLRGDGFETGYLTELGRADTSDLLNAARIACLSTVGVNILQQRLICSLTRLDVPTQTIWEAFGHTFEEADLLEEWTESLSGIDTDSTRVAQDFESWIRSEGRQEKLRDPQQRAPIRAAMRSELRRRRET